MINQLITPFLRPTLHYMSRNRLPKIAGILSLPNLSANTKIERDSHGIAYLTAETEQDLFFAQGVVHAQDRLWQMEINRRAANGTVSALVGDVGLPTDRLARTLGFRRMAQQSWDLLDDYSQNVVEWYCSGINAYLPNCHPPNSPSNVAYLTTPPPRGIRSTLSVFPACKPLS